MILLTDEEIKEAMIRAIANGQEYALVDGEPKPLPERLVAKAQLKNVVEYLKSHNKRAETGIENGERWFTHNDGIWLDNEYWQALLKEVEE